MPLYTGVNGTNRLVRDLYQGVNGVNRSIGQLYQGVNGVNRQIFSSNLLINQGQTQVVPFGTVSNPNNIIYNTNTTADGYELSTFESSSIVTFSLVATQRTYDVSRFNQARLRLRKLSNANPEPVNLDLLIVNSLNSQSIFDPLYSKTLQINIGGLNEQTFTLDISDALVTGHIVIIQPYLGQGTVQLSLTESRLI